ncbi:hypothetical protein, partial [Fangia hongkongensis]
MAANSFKQTLRFFAIRKSTYFVIFIYTAFISLLMLAVPVITQTVINVVAYGVVLPVIILAVILFVLLSVAVLLTLLNRVVVENLQQRL